MRVMKAEQRIPGADTCRADKPAWRGQARPRGSPSQWRAGAAWARGGAGGRGQAKRQPPDLV